MAQEQKDEMSRDKLADIVPFVLRAWWMRDFNEFDNEMWNVLEAVDIASLSVYSSPVCDFGVIGSDENE